MAGCSQGKHAVKVCIPNMLYIIVCIFYRRLANVGAHVIHQNVELVVVGGTKFVNRRNERLNVSLPWAVVTSAATPVSSNLVDFEWHLSNSSKSA